jgi:hypothetical protein
MRNRERQLWTEHVRQREARKHEKPVRKKPEPAPEELEAALDELTGEGRCKPG